ncbi:MAG: hypothetical protein ACRDFB_08545, partial [Rhabdochlamydiaceae bacterium]
MIFLLLIGLPILLLIDWFHKGLLYGGGDIGLSLYNPILILHIVENSWWSGQETGFSYPNQLSTVPMYFILSVIQKLGANPMMIQIFFFFFILSLSATGMYFLTKKLSQNTRIALFVTFFYEINPYVMINVWHRFSYTAMVMLVAIPWTVYLIMRFLKEKKYRFLFILLFSSLLFAYDFNTPAFIATWWFIIVLTWIYVFFTDATTNKKRVYYILSFILFCLFWIGIN